MLVTLVLLASESAYAQTTPQLTAIARGGGQIDDVELVDTATLSGSAAATGTIRFTLYGPDDPTCSDDPFTTSSISVDGDGEYVSDPEYPDALGGYRFVASYGGDADNAGVATACSDPGQGTVVTAAEPIVASTASPGVTVGRTISDAARLVEAYAPTGDLVFALYGPDDATCSGPPVARSTGPLSPDARATSAPFAPGLPGVYRWVASYAGDALNQPASGACGDVGESVTVSAPTKPNMLPGLALHASSGVAIGGQVSATATLSGLAGLTGVLTFRAYGPGDDICTDGAVGGSSRMVFGTGDYASEPIVALKPGVYRWIAEYVGEAGTLATNCGDPAAATAVVGPVLDRSFIVSRVDGTVRVKKPAAASRRATAARAVGFVRLFGSQSFPVGSTIDARKGHARLDAAGASRGAPTQTGTFKGDPFVARQEEADGLVELDLRTDARRRRVCGVRAGGAVYTAKSRPPSGRVVGRLRGRVRGDFDMHGRYSSVSAQQAEWTMVERCRATITQVVSGTVKVTDRRRQRTVTVRPGRPYVVRAPS